MKLLVDLLFKASTNGLSTGCLSLMTQVEDNFKKELLLRAVAQAGHDFVRKLIDGKLGVVNEDLATDLLSRHVVTVDELSTYFGEQLEALL
jgi:hypothetical protein